MVLRTRKPIYTPLFRISGQYNKIIKKEKRNKQKYAILFVKIWTAEIFFLKHFISINSNFTDNVLETLVKQ